MIEYSNNPSHAAIRALPIILSGLDETYPGFASWLTDKVLPSFKDGSGKIIVAKDRGDIVGVALGKQSSENKIRCVRVVPEYRNKGIGFHLIERMMREIDCATPLLTVPQTLIHDYARILVNHFKYDLTHVEKGMYVKDKLEYIFNGEVD